MANLPIDEGSPEQPVSHAADHNGGTEEAGSRRVSPGLARFVQPDETVDVEVVAKDAIVGVSQSRVLVVSDDRLRLDLPIGHLRRIQLDIERDRPATVVIVPETIRHEPQLLEIAPGQYEAALRAVVLLGLGLVRSEAAEA